MDNVLLTIKKIENSEISTTPAVVGQVLLASNPITVLLDIDDQTRKDITSECVVKDTVDELLAVEPKTLNKLYVCMNDCTMYRFDNLNLIQITTTDGVQNTIYDIIAVLPTIMIEAEKLIAPATLTSQVITSNGDSLTVALEDSKLLTVIKSSAKYYETKTAGQRIFDIKFPKENYNFQNGDLMTVVVRSQMIDPARYVINNGCLIFDDTIADLKAGEIILIIFYYRMIYDLNLGVVLGTNNLADGCVTSEKISPNFRLSAEYVNETLNRIFFSREEQAKLKGIDYNATNYHHPETHPATMIVEDAFHKFLTDTKIAEFEAKANASDVYTIKQVDDRIAALKGATQDELDTLQELANALNNDPEFSATMVKELAKKATKEELATLQKDVDRRTLNTDYIRNPIYGTPAMIYDTVNDKYNYTLTVDDGELQEYLDGMGLVIKIPKSNGGDTWIRIYNGKDNLDFKHVVTQEGYNLVDKEFTEGSIYSIRYNATQGNFILQGKGGVKLVDTDKVNYTIATGETIKRGEICDIINGYLYSSRPKPRILSRTKTIEEKFRCDGKIRVFGMSENEIAVFWKEDVGLYAQRFIITNGFVDINATTGKYLVINGSCIDYEIERVANRKFIVVTSDIQKVFTAMTVTLDAGEFLLGNKYTRQEQFDITNPTVVHLNNDKSIIAWQADQNTRTLFVSTPLETINIISNRDNIDYPLNKVCKINDTQIIFAKVLPDNRIRKWSMSIVSNDFFNSTLDTIDAADTTVTFSNLAINKIRDNAVMFSATTSNLAKIYSWEVEIEFNAGSTVVNTYIEDKLTTAQNRSLVPVKMNKLDKYAGYYSYASLYNYNVPYVLDNGGLGPDCIKIAVGKFNPTLQIIDSITDIPLVTNDISYSMMSDTMMVVALNYLDTAAGNKKLYFVIVDISKSPDCVALSDGVAGEIIKVDKW